MRTGKLMGPAEIGQRLRVGRTRAKYYFKRPDWPAPLDELAMGKVWWTADIEAWIRAHRPDLAEEPEGE